MNISIGATARPRARLAARTLAVAAAALASAAPALANVDDPSILSEASEPAAKTDLAATREALSLSMGSRLEAIRKQGPQGYRNLVKIMFDQKSPMALRWKAVTAVGRIGGELSAPEIERAYKRGEWFMRSAALIAMRNVDKQKSMKWARELLSDRALVVRSAAVDAIEESKDASANDLLWSKLGARENFNEGDSLWIRRRIVEALAKLESPGAEKKFVKLLSDKDDSLHAPAIEALERLTNKRLGAPDAAVADKRALWLKAYGR